MSETVGKLRMEVLQLLEEKSILQNQLKVAEAEVVLEREACAKIAESEKVNAEETGDESDRAYNRACEDVAAAIRSRGKV